MFAALKTLWPHIQPYRGTLGFGIGAFGVARLFEAMIPMFLAIGIDRINDGNWALGMPIFGIIGSVCARYLIVTAARYAVRTTSLNVAFDLRQAFYQALQAQGPGFFAQHTVGDMMTRAIADISLIQRLIAMGTILLVILVYASIVGFGFMLYYSPSLTLLLLPPLPFVFLYARHSALKMGVASQVVQDRMSDLGTQVQENLSGIRTIQAMVQEENEIYRFAKVNEAYGDAFYEQARYNSLMSAWMPLLAATCTIIILGYGGHLVLTGELSVGAFVAYFMYVNMVVQPFRVAGFIINLFQRAVVATRRLHEVFDQPPEFKDQPSGKTPAHLHGEILIKSLNFSYPGSDISVLNGIDLNIQPGESIAIMGRVGSGKTTLLNAIVRLIQTPPGSIFFDGHDCLEFPLAQIRAQITMVPQDPFLFADSLASNLTYDDPDRGLDRIWAAADAADFKTTIESFPDGLDTLVGERGVTLSGGQKQRATLARGLIRQAPILLLDDCFASVDTATEDRILNALTRLRAGQTTVMVSHRVSTARHADRIILLDQGRIIESGSHESLLARKGHYAELERLQRQGTGGSSAIDVSGRPIGTGQLDPSSKPEKGDTDAIRGSEND